MEAYVGADWSTTKLACATAVGQETPRRIRGVGPSLEEVKGLVERVLLRHPDARQVHVLIEGGAPGWVRLLQSAGAVVHVVDPRQALKFAQSRRSSGAKSDGADAVSLVEMLRSPAHRPPETPLTDDSEVIRRLGAAHEEASKDRTRACQRLRQILQEYMPLLSRAIPDLDREWVRRLLREIPTPWHARELTQGRLRDVTPRCRRRDLLWDAFQRTSCPWLDEPLAKLEAERVHHQLDLIELHDARIRTLNEQLDLETKDLMSRQTLESVDGIGLRQASELIAFAFSQPLQHRDQAGILLGACPVFVGSGTLPSGEKKGYAHMRRAAPSRARRTTYLLGRLASQRLRWAKAMYADGRSRGQSAATTYRRIARSLLRILTSMIRKGEPYDEDRYIQALKSRGVSWAISL